MQPTTTFSLSQLLYLSQRYGNNDALLAESFEDTKRIMLDKCPPEDREFRLELTSSDVFKAAFDTGARNFFISILEDMEKEYTREVEEIKKIFRSKV